ncbi:MAG TPA: hypothetical protein PLP86_08720, partial [Armatimonadota bacterium]|nr:hypothetical protein [Armatimonadota bacterium]
SFEAKVNMVEEIKELISSADICRTTTSSYWATIPKCIIHQEPNRQFTHKGILMGEQQCS